MEVSSVGNRYVVPQGRWGRLGLRGFNGAVAFAARRGLGLAGARVLAVRGRRSRQWRTVPVNLLEVDGVRYLVAPRGRTEWVRNLRAAGGGELRLGRRTEPFTAAELADGAKVAVIREYLRRWRWEVGVLLADLAQQLGVQLDAKTDEAVLLKAAPGIPVFRLDP